MALSSTLSNVIIDGNTFDTGFTTSNGTTTISYTYDRVIDAYADCKIVDNHFAGIANNTVSGSIINIASSSSNIIGNTFIRGSSSLFAYIDGSGTSYSNITNNFFDKSTIDGSSTTLVKGIPSSSIVDKNINQTFITQALWADTLADINAYGVLKTSSGTNPVLVVNPIIVEYNANYLSIQYEGSMSQFATRIVNLNTIIPIGAKIISIAFTITSIASSNPLSFTEISPGDNYIAGNLYYSDNLPGTKPSTPTI